MLEIANEFNDKDKTLGARYLDACAKFRLPYWDIVMPRRERQPGAPPASIWATPQLLAKQQVYVRLPKDPKNLVPINNPMYSFAFPSPDDYERTGRADLLARMGNN